MLHCGSADPKRRRIFEMKQRGIGDDEIVNTIVREEGVAALSGPLHHALFVWMMPGIALLIGFFVYTAYVRRNRKSPAPLTPVDQALIDRYRTQIDRELDESRK
jgi:cytochrome c-type biogenesis protein CcmH/NrfF